MSEAPALHGGDLDRYLPFETHPCRVELGPVIRRNPPHPRLDASLYPRAGIGVESQLVEVGVHA